jgi:hypothetical protein
VLVRRHRADDSVTRAAQAILRSADRRRHYRSAARLTGCRRGILLLGGCRVREALRGVSSNVHPAAFDELMPKTLGNGDRRPAPASRPRVPRVWGERPIGPGHGRQGGKTRQTTPGARPGD